MQPQMQRLTRTADVTIFNLQCDRHCILARPAQIWMWRFPLDSFRLNLAHQGVMTAAVPGLTVRVRADRPSAVHLRAEIDLEVLGVVKDVEEGAALVKLGDAEEKKKK